LLDKRLRVLSTNAGILLANPLASPQVVLVS
jgi:hypothetical protein